MSAPLPGLNGHRRPPTVPPLLGGDRKLTVRAHAGGRDSATPTLPPPTSYSPPNLGSDGWPSASQRSEPEDFPGSERPANSDDPPWAIGIDVGGTKIAAGLVALSSGRLLAQRLVPTGVTRGGVAVLADSIALVEELAGEARSLGGVSVGVGIAVAEIVDPRGEIRSNHSIGWEGLSPRPAFAHIAPVVVEADVRAAALGEARYGAGRPFGRWLYVSIGTGISACLVRDGHPDPGARGGALVLSSGPLTFPCAACGEARPFVLEEYAAGPALAARYAAATGLPIAGAEAVTAAAARGDERAAEVLRTAATALGSAIGWAVNLLDPEAIVVGGGLGLAGGLYGETLMAATRVHIWHPAARDLPILPAWLGTTAGVVGAAVAASGPFDSGTRWLGGAGERRRASMEFQAAERDGVLVGVRSGGEYAGPDRRPPDQLQERRGNEPR